MTTEVIISHYAHLAPAKLCGDAKGGKARFGIIHRAGEQRPHEKSLSKRGPALCGLVRPARNRPIADVQAIHVLGTNPGPLSPRALPDWRKALKPGITEAFLDRIASAQTDLAAAQQMHRALIALLTKCRTTR